MSEGAISLLCCCGDEPATAGFYVCEPQVCPEGYRRGWRTIPDFFVVQIDEVTLEYLLANDWLDGYEWVWGGQYWRLGDFVEAATLEEVAQELGGTVDEVNLITEDLSGFLYSFAICDPDATLGPMPHHRVTGATIAANPTETNSLVVFPPFCSDNFLVFHMVGSFVYWWGQDSIARTAPEYALPASLQAEVSDSQGFRIAFYEIPFGVLSVELQQISHFEYVPGLLNYDRFTISNRQTNIICYTSHTYQQTSTLPSQEFPPEIQIPNQPGTNISYSYPIGTSFGFRIIASERAFYNDYPAGSQADGFVCKGHHDGTAPACFTQYPETAFFTFDSKARGSGSYPDSVPVCYSVITDPPCAPQRFDYHLYFDPCTALSTGEISVEGEGACCPDLINPGINYAYSPYQVPVPDDCEDVVGGYFYECTLFGIYYLRSAPLPEWRVTQVYSI